jgi:chemotaxis protein CheC
MHAALPDSDKDLLKEFFNHGVGKAATALSHLMHKRQAITLTVPDIRVIPPDEFPKELARFTETVLAVKSEVKGTVNGITVLIFFEEEIEWIVQHCLSDREKERMEAGTLKVPLLLEISNILTASVLTQFTNVLGLHALGLPPESGVSHRGDTLRSLFYDLDPFQPIVFSVTTEFIDHNKVIEIPFLFLLEYESLTTLLAALHKKGSSAVLMK